MTSFLTFALSRQPKMSVIGNFIVISMCLNELSSSLTRLPIGVEKTIILCEAVLSLLTVLVAI